MITSLSAANFKSWKRTGDVRLAPITGLFGSNSSGKTSFLQLLLMLKQTAESTDRALVLNLGDDRSLVELGVFRDLVFAHGAESALKIGLDWTLDSPLEIADPEQKGRVLLSGDSLGFECEVRENGAGRLAIAELAFRFGGQLFSLKRKPRGNTYALSSKATDESHPFHFKRAVGRAWDLPAPVKCYGFPDQVKGYFQNAGFLSDLELEFERLFGHVYYLGPLRDYPKRQYTWAGAQPADMGQRGEKVVDALLASRERRDMIARGPGKKRFTVEEYVAYWLRELGLIHDFAVEPITEGSNLFQVWVSRSANSARVLLTDVGFGVSQILPVLTLCYYVPQGSTILMEQPEIHLHPSVQSGLADVFIDAMKTRHVQIIVESHSEHLLRRLQRRIAEEQLTDAETAFYFCEVKGGESALTPLKVDMFGSIENWPENFFGDEFGEIASMARARINRQKRDQRA